MVRKLWPALALMILLGSAPDLLSQRVTRCDQAAMDPVHDGSRLLGRYYEASGGIGGLGCWVHWLPNGKDFVVTPRGWHPDMLPGRARLLSAVKEALADARTTYSSYGNTNNAFGFLLNDDGAHEDFMEAYAVYHGACWMEAKARGVSHWGSINKFKQAAAHEAAHCFSTENNLTGAFSGSSIWVEESLAEFLSAQVYPSANLEHERPWETASPFQVNYNAHVLFQDYANQNSIAASISLATQLAGQSGLAGQARYLRDNSLASWLHEAFERSFMGRVSDVGGGEIAATFSSNGLDDIDLPEGATEADLPDISGYRLHTVNLVIPAGFDAEFPPFDSRPDLDVRIMRGDVRRAGEPWARTARVPGDCENTLSVPFAISRIHPNDASGEKLAVSLSEKNDCEEDEEEPTEEEPTEEPLPREGSEGRSGSSGGDPHLTTYDGYRYPFMGVGEFTLTKSSDGWFEVQVRQTPVLGGGGTQNTAVAMRVGKDIVAFYSYDRPDSVETALRINGEPKTVTEGRQIKLPGGGSLGRVKTGHRFYKRYVVKWPSGEVAVISSLTGFYNLDISALPIEGGELLGMLGNMDGRKSNDLTTKDGTKIKLRAKPYPGILDTILGRSGGSDGGLQEFHRTVQADLGNSWRVTPSNTLFEYSQEKPFTAFADTSVFLVPPIDRAAGLRALFSCNSAGVDDEEMRSCLFDVSVTGNDAFAEAASATAKKTIKNLIRKEASKRLDAFKNRATDSVKKKATDRLKKIIKRRGSGG